MRGSCEEEIVVMKRLRTGSKAAFEFVVKKYMKTAYFTALGLVGNREDALDLSQEAFVRAYRNIGRLNPGGHFFPWFYQILRNVCFTHLRRKKNERSHFANESSSEAMVAGSGDCFVPDVVAERNEIKDKVWKAIGKLDNKHREVIVLRHFQNLSYEQIATILFCNKGTVTSRLYYARKGLKEILDSEKGGWQE